MKKIFSAVIIMLIVVSSFSLSSFTVFAESTGTNYKSAFSFEKLEDDFQLGGIDDEGLNGKTKYAVVEGATVGRYIDLRVVSKGGYSGKAVEYKSLDAPESGAYTPIKFALSQNNPLVVDFSGATDFQFYIDTTNWGEKRGVRPVISENGCDLAGETINETSIWLPSNDKDSFIEDGKGGWLKAKVSDGTIEIPENYKGFVRVPIDSFTAPNWDSPPPDTNGKFDCKEIISIALEVGCYAKNKGKSIVFDEIGFLGNFAEGATTAPLLQGQSAPPAATDDSTKEEASKGVSLTTNSNNSSSDNIMDTTTIIIIAVTAVVVIAAVIIIIIVMRKKPTTDESKSNETDMTDKTDKTDNKK